MHNVLAGETLTTTALNDWTPQAGTGTVTPATNFTVASFTTYTIAGVTWFTVTLTYSGSTLTGTATGGLTLTSCCTLPFGPQAVAYLPYVTSQPSSGLLAVQSSGLCQLEALAPTATITSGRNVAFTGVFLTG